MASPSCSLCAVLVPRTDRRVLRSPATSSVFSVLSDLTVQLLYMWGSLGSRPSPFTHAYISKRMRYPDSGSRTGKAWA